MCCTPIPGKAPGGNLKYTEFLRIEKLKRTLNILAYASLGIDIAIALVTLISLNVYSSQLSKIQYYLNISLTIEVIITFVVLILLVCLYHYQKIMDNLARFSSMVIGETKHHRKRS